jgi:hypothetical protein
LSQKTDSKSKKRYMFLIFAATTLELCIVHTLAEHSEMNILAQMSPYQVGYSAHEI